LATPKCDLGGRAARKARGKDKLKTVSASATYNYNDILLTSDRPTLKTTSNCDETTKTDRNPDRAEPQLTAVARSTTSSATLTDYTAIDGNERALIANSALKR